MSLNDKYIINGNTLSAIGDALRSVLGEKTEKTAEVVYCSRSISKSFGPTSATSTITASDISSSLRNIEDKFTKYVRAKLTSSSGSSPIIQQTPIQENIYELPITLYISGAPAQNPSGSFDIFPLDDNFNYIEYDSTKHNTSSYYHKQVTVQVKRTFLVEDIPTLISNVPIDYQGLSYGYITRQDPMSFSVDTSNNNYLTFIPLTSGQKIGFCVGETVSNRLRVGFFQGKTYSDFQQYITQPASSQTSIYTNGVCVSGASAELTGDGLLKRFYYTAPSDGELIITTSNLSVSAPLHIWRA